VYIVSKIVIYCTDLKTIKSVIQQDGVYSVQQNAKQTSFETNTFKYVGLVQTKLCTEFIIPANT